MLLRRPDGKWVCTWLVNEDGKVIANTETDDLVLWKPQDYYAAGDKKNGNRNIERQQVTFPDGDRLKGIVIKVERAVVNNLIAEYERSQYRNARQSELMRDDPMRFKGLKDVTFTVTANPNDKKAISPELFGIFFEDINYAADGGLYAELCRTVTLNIHPMMSADATRTGTLHTPGALKEGELRCPLTPLHLCIPTIRTMPCWT